MLKWAALCSRVYPSVATFCSNSGAATVAGVAALALCCTRPQADTSEGRNARLKTAEEVLERGTEWFADLMLPKLLGKTARESRPDLVDGARRMMLKMSPQPIAQVQRGMAARPDSVATLKTINVPTLLVMGEEDGIATPSDGELMRQHIPGSRLAVVPKAGHFAAWGTTGSGGQIAPAVRGRMSVAFPGLSQDPLLQFSRHG